MAYLILMGVLVVMLIKVGVSPYILSRGRGYWVGIFVSGLALVSSGSYGLEPISIAKTSFLNLKQDAAEAAAAGKILMVIFEQENCSYCMEMRRVNLTDPEAVEIIRRNFDLVTVDLLGDRELTTFSGAVMPEKQYAQSLKVQLTPMTVFFAADGTELFRMAGYYKPPMFKSALRYVADGRYKQESFREYSRRVAADSSFDTLKDEPFFEHSGDLKGLLKSSAKKGKGMALVFEQKQCLGCDELHSQTFKNKAVIDGLTGAFSVARIDIWGNRQIKNISGSAVKESRFAEAMDIRYTPTIIFFDQMGKEIFRFDSYRKPEHFAIVLKYLSSGAYKKYASFQDWLRAESK